MNRFYNFQQDHDEQIVFDTCEGIPVITASTLEKKCQGNNANYGRLCPLLKI